MMARITVNTGPTDANAEPGSLVEDAQGWITPLHPSEQGAVCPGINSSVSDENKPSISGTSELAGRAPARTTESPSEQGRTANSTARSTGGSIKGSSGKK